MSTFQSLYKSNASISDAAVKRAERRADAIRLQKTRRHSAINLKRKGLSDLELSSSDEEAASSKINSFGIQVDAPVRSNKSDKYDKFAHKLMFAQTLRLDEGLPADLLSGWSICVLPKGKRCLVRLLHSAIPIFECDQVLTYASRRFVKRSVQSHNTMLLDRKTGRPFHHVLTVLPPNCILDCLYDAALHVLWLIDILSWNEQAISESPVDFRNYWLQSKMAELPRQICPGSDPMQRLLVAAAPSCLPPHSLDSLKTLLEQVEQVQTTAINTLTLLPGASPVYQSSQVSFTPDGLLLYPVESLYEPEDSDEYHLSLWMPIKETAGHFDVAGFAQAISNVMQ